MTGHKTDLGGQAPQEMGKGAKKHIIVFCFVQEGLSHARKTGNDKKLHMVASRRKKLDDRMGLEKNAKGHRLHVNRSAAADLAPIGGGDFASSSAFDTPWAACFCGAFVHQGATRPHHGPCAPWVQTTLLTPQVSGIVES